MMKVLNALPSVLAIIICNGIGLYARYDLAKAGKPAMGICVLIGMLLISIVYAKLLKAESH